VLGKELSNPIPSWAEHGADRGVVAYGVAPNMSTPNPDPGEEYQHVNTQLFRTIDPPANQGALADAMIAPFNAPAAADRTPTMDGSVADYVSAFTAEMGRQPTFDEYSQIMTGHTVEQVPVLSSIARGFATFDHWHCEVPSQTFTNRSFYHAPRRRGSSSTRRTATSRSTTTPRRSSSGSMRPACRGGSTSTRGCGCR
jgi:phospholipase C